MHVEEEKAEKTWMFVYDIRVKQDRPGKEQVHSAGRPQMKVNRKHASTSPFTLHSLVLSLLSHTAAFLRQREGKQTVFVAFWWQWIGWEWCKDVTLTWRFSSLQQSVAMVKTLQPSLRWSGPRHQLRWASNLTLTSVWPSIHPAVYSLWAAYQLFISPNFSLIPPSRWAFFFIG